MTAPLRVAYLVSQYPAPSHAFIEREVAGLRDLGVEVDTFSVRPAPPGDLLDLEMSREAATTTVVQGDLQGVLADLRATARAHSGALLSTLARAARTGEASAKSRVWQVFYLAEAVRIHRAMRQRGIHHIHAHFANNGADIARLVVALGRAVDGTNGDWRWSFSMHGPTEFEAVHHFDLANKVRDADGVACISHFARSQLMRLIEPEHWPKLQLVRMSVDINRYSPAEGVETTGDGRLRLLAVGRLVPEKGWPLLVDAVAGLVLSDISVVMNIHFHVEGTKKF